MSRYSIGEKLGEGCFGQVMKIIDKINPHKQLVAKIQ